MQCNVVKLVKRCKVRFQYQGEEVFAIVKNNNRSEDNIIDLYVLNGPINGDISVKTSEYHFRSGFEVGDTVVVSNEEYGYIATNRQEGKVLGVKRVADQDLVAVHFFIADKVLWIPFEQLTLIQDHLKNFMSGKVNSRINHTERFRLKTLGYGIQMWNQNTGSLSSLDIDPLPHQINLVHHILESGNLNWLIADDVGLGKTIETGMLITALKYREQAKRILLVTPAGLTKQWKDELYYKFSFEDFVIFGDDFNITEARQWKMYDHVIASIDRLKNEETLEQLVSSGYWDLIIFDEAHRLTRTQMGNKYSMSGRYHLARKLRRLTDSLILLSATPHQGKQDQFQALLELLRPELKRDIYLLNQKPEILSEMVYRNNKSEVTDLAGELLFKGKETYPVELPVSEKALEFDQLLQQYLRKSSEQSVALGGSEGRAIGFVIAIYRKLAASSIAAILNALQNRLKRLSGGGYLSEDVEDERYMGEFEEQIVNQDTKRFIENEERYLEELICLGKEVRNEDLKLAGFLDKVIAPILEKNPLEKVVVFTEYLSTQAYLAEALEKKYGSDKVSLINGSMTHEERAVSIDIFNNSGQFILSTEAGGEGINLQHNCHMLINFDLPWNPMRLVQRIGRVYRYGQEKKVFVFNIFSEGTADDGIVKLLYQKIDQVVDDLSAISNEFDDSLKDDIFGNIADLADVSDILEKSLFSTPDEIEHDLENALSKARDASEKQRELFSYVAKYDANALSQEFVITLDHVNAFLRGMFTLFNVEIIDEMYAGDVLRIRLSEELAAKIGFNRRVLEITTNRKIKLTRPTTEVMDLNHPLMIYFIDKATSYEFGGAVSYVSSDSVDGVAAITAVVKWQNVQGTNIHKDMLTFTMHEQGYSLNPSGLSQWLLEPSTSTNQSENLSRKPVKYAMDEAIEQVLSEALKSKSKENLIPHNAYILSSAWIV